MKDKFLINTVTAWDEPPRARHQVTYALAKNHQTVFIARNRVGLCRIKIEQVHERLTVINPVFPIDYRLRIRIPIINELYQNWLYRKIKKDYSSNYLVVNFDFTAHQIFKHFNTVVYYCNDECIGNTKYPNWLTDFYYKLSEQKVIKRSLFCIATSPYLTQKLSRLNSKTYEIPLGANSVQFDISYNRGNIDGKIIICLMGNINLSQVPIELINKIISYECFQLVLIGPIKNSFLQKLESRDKVIIKGVLKGPDLIEALLRIDIGLALYNTKRINPGTSPNKLWQYLSVGKPVIVSQLNNLNIQEFPPKSVYIYHENDSLKDLISQAYNDNSEELFRERIDFTAHNTWDKRIEIFLNLVEKNIL